MYLGKAHPKTLQRTHWLYKSWVQLGLVFVFGVILPPLIWYEGSLTPLGFPAGYNSFVACALAALMSWYSLERLSLFAKARRLSYIVPLNTLIFGGIAAIIGLLRLPYSVTILTLSFASVLLLTFSIAALTRKSSTVQWLVPGGAIDEIKKGFGHSVMLEMSELELMIADGGTDGSIIADLHHDHSSEWEALLAEAAINGIPVYHYRQLLELQTGQVRIDHMRENMLGSLIPNLAYLGFKRIGDIISTLLLLPVLLPIFAVIATAIMLDSKGSPFFIQKRVGYKGNTFRMYKFRSMVEREIPSDPDANVEDAITKDGDMRITRVGRFIRKTRLDELPQAVNILFGDMSWIGPRPEAESLSALYQSSIPFYRYRHIVRPGITGWAQVNQGHVAAVGEITEKLRFDFYYVRNVSLWIDILIVLKTLRVVIFGIGAK